MNNIPHILDTIKSLSSQLFLFRTNVEPIELLSTVPEELSDIFDNQDFIDSVEECNHAFQKLNQYINPYLKRIYKYTHSKKHSSDSMVPYADFLVDKSPELRTAIPDQLSADDIIQMNNIKPVNHRSDFAYEGNCPFCSADNKYIYLNNNKNKNRQYLCKVCKHTFTDKISPRDTSGYYCPYCHHKLSPHHDRKNYTVYVCQNSKCSYYKEKKAKKEETEDWSSIMTSSKQFRYRYHYREFKFNMQEIRDYFDNPSFESGPVDLSRIHVDEHTLGLILTYYINYGLSSRKVAAILRDIHGISISHQTVRNYAESVSSLVKDMVDYYPYDLSHTQCGDETYVHVNGKNHYVFFFSDPIKRIITSYQIYSTRDTKNAVQSMWNVMRKYSPYPDNLTFITDANPIYNAAQVFFEMNGLKFDLHQVTGVKNFDEESRKYRPIKQKEERLNRTYKENYYGTNGYGSLDQANKYMVLYVAFFNFLRRHSALGYKTPVSLDIFSESDLMPDKWLKIIQASSAYHKQPQA